MTVKRKRKQVKRRVKKSGGEGFRSWLLLLCGLVGLAGVAGYMGYLQVRSELPPIFSYDDYKSSSVQMSKVFASDGTVVGTFYDERRSVVPMEAISEDLQNAVLVAEDRDFYEHDGLDFFSIARALVKDILAGAYVQGGSTITQQVAKTFYLSTEKTLTRKVREAVLAYALEQGLSKRDILGLYLNQIYFGHGRYGVAEACRFYFQKEPQAVSIGEAATLAGVIRSPERLSPFKHRDKIRPIRDAIIRAMKAERKISEEQMNAALEEPINAISPPSDSPEWAAYFVDAVRRKLASTLNGKALRVGGYQIHTGLHAAAQKRVVERLDEEAITESLGGLETAFVQLNGVTGVVEVLQGGRKFSTSSFNRAVQSRRSIGSVVKPLLFAFAIGEERVKTTQTFMNERVAYKDGNGRDWSPRNFNGKYDEEDWTLKDALAFSVNTIAVQVLAEVGVELFASFLNRISPGSAVGNHWSNALGSFGMSPLQLAGVFSVFPGNGVLSEPILIHRVLDREGRNLWKRPGKGKRVLPKHAIRSVGEMMREVVTTGTGKKAALKGRVVRGKTGTSNGYKDSWFVGYVGDTVAVLWAGRDDNGPVDGGGGGALAAPTWQHLMH